MRAGASEWISEPGSDHQHAPRPHWSGQRYGPAGPNAARSARGNLRRRPAQATRVLASVVRHRHPQAVQVQLRGSAAPQAATSGPSLLPRTACTGAYWAARQYRRRAHVPRVQDEVGLPQVPGDPRGHDFQWRGACVSTGHHPDAAILVVDGYDRHPAARRAPTGGAAAPRHRPPPRLARPRRRTAVHRPPPRLPRPRRPPPSPAAQAAATAPPPPSPPAQARGRW